MADNYSETIDALLDAADDLLAEAMVADLPASLDQRVRELSRAADHVRETERQIQAELGGPLAERRQGMGPDAAEPVTMPVDTPEAARVARNRAQYVTNDPDDPRYGDMVMRPADPPSEGRPLLSTDDIGECWCTVARPGQVVRSHAVGCPAGSE